MDLVRSVRVSVRRLFGEHPHAEPYAQAMHEIPDRAPRERRSVDDPGYARLEDFKADLKAAVIGADTTRRLPQIRSIAAAMGGASPSTVHSALTPTELGMPSDGTVRSLAMAYDRDGVDYWLARRGVIASQRRKVVGDDLPRPSRRRGVVWAAALLAGAVVVAVAAMSISLARSPTIDVPSGTATDQASDNASSSDPSSSSSPTDVEVPTDYSDPNAAGCVDAGSERLQTEVIESVGLVSLVYSPACHAYWARAERTDGRESGNYIDLSITPQDSARAPSVANDPDVAVIYTYLLTAGDASGFCVDATFWVGEESTPSPQICVDKQG